MHHTGVIIVRFADSFLKNGRVGSHPQHAIIVNQPFQFSAVQQAALDIVVPDALAVSLDIDRRISGHSGVSFKRTFFECARLVSE